MSTIYDGLFGCIAGSWIGSAMGDPVEGWPWKKIQETYGVLDRFEPTTTKSRLWDKPAGYTEDGIERQKLMAEAIIEKQDRINARDLVATWLKVCDPQKMRFMTVPYDIELLRMAQAAEGLQELYNISETRMAGIFGPGIPPEALGLFNKYQHLIVTSRSGHAICAINACDEDAVIEDTYNVFRVYQSPTSDAFPFGAAYNAAVVHAMRPEATVDSVVQTALDRAEPMVRGHVEKALEIAEKYDDPLDMREGFDDLYTARDVIFDMSRIHENVAKAIAIFFAAKGDFRKATIAAVNFGRDTDCTAASACGLVGAFCGASAIPQEWIDIVEKGTRDNPYTCTNRGMKETADGIHGAYMNRLEKMRRFSVYVKANS